MIASTEGESSPLTWYMFSPFGVLGTSLFQGSLAFTRRNLLPVRSTAENAPKESHVPLGCGAAVVSPQLTSADLTKIGEATNSFQPPRLVKLWTTGHRKNHLRGNKLWAITCQACSLSDFDVHWNGMKLVLSIEDFDQLPVTWINK